jgi:hypothetical protein
MKAGSLARKSEAARDTARFGERVHGVARSPSHLRGDRHLLSRLPFQNLWTLTEVNEPGVL